MMRRRCLIVICVLFAGALLWGPSQGWAQSPQGNKAPVVKEGKVTRDDVFKKFGKVTPSEQKAAAKRNRQLGLYPGVAGQAPQGPGGAASGNAQGGKI